jgi:hypothetical protein
MATVALTVSSNAAEILRAWSSWPKESQTAIIKNVARELILLQGEVRSRAALKLRSGTRGLARRLTSYARATDLGLGFDAAIGFRKTTGFPYELSQEFGARAAAGKAMAIPLTAKARRAGSPRNMAVRLFVPPGTHILAESTLAGFRKTGNAFIAHYVLVKSIKPRLNFVQTVFSAAERLSKAILDGFKGRAS